MPEDGSPSTAFPPLAAARQADSILMRRASSAAVAVALVLVAIKAAAWLATGAVAMLGTLVDSLLDAVASTANLVAIRHAITPADAEHRFGHGKAEPLAGLAQAVIILGSVGFLVVQAVRRLLHPQPLTESLTGIVVIAISILLTLGLVLYQRQVVRRTGSVAISADRLHYAGDLLSNLGVVLALVLGGAGLLWADPLIAFAIAGYIGWTAWSILRAAFDQLMDRELPEAQRAQIRRIAAAHPDIIAIHDLRTRRSGLRIFIQLHAVMAPHLPLIEAHRIADDLEARIRAAFPRAEVIVHQDPAGIAERPAFE